MAFLIKIIIIGGGLNGVGDYYEVRACSAPISRIAISSDGMLLACSGDDGTLMLFDVRDKERSLTQGAKKDKDALGWSHEVLTSKADVEELRQSVQDLEAKVLTVVVLERFR
jgi:WD40 repeat protein